MQPGRSHDYRLCRRVDGTHIEQPSTNIDLERQTANGARHSGRDQGNRPGCSRVRPGGPNATVEASGKQRTGATAVDMKLEIVAVPVSDVDRAKDRYQSLGWLLDADFVTGPDFRVIQMNPGLGSRSFSAPGSPQTRPVRRRASPPACRTARHPRAAYGSLTGLAEALRRVRRSRTASTRSRPRSAPRNAAHRARGRAADVAASPCTSLPIPRSREPPTTSTAASSSFRQLASDRQPSTLPSYRRRLH
jgi:catechol 2,3-dioxygenase-like lactoylglutathione lyase family enzyme